MTIKKYIKNFDYISFILTISLLIIGLLFVFSSTCKDGIPFSTFFKKQLFGALTGIIIYIIFSVFDLSTMCRWSFFCYPILILTLLYTIFGGWIGMGAKRWISLYFITFQPSELARLMLPLALAFYFSEQKKLKQKVLTFGTFAIPILLTFASFFLVLKQPDLGTALVILFTGLIILWLNHIPKKFFVLLGIVCLLGAPIIWKNLKPYQQKRILVLMGHGDTKKERYQVEQSKIAIGSGGIAGKGYLQGTQNRLSFLPEARTDFIFSVLCEEWGFLGALLVLILFSLLFIRITYVLFISRKLLDQLAGMGLIIPIVLSTIINTGMVTGLLPIVGIPLPLFTYGVTNLWITLAALGAINNVFIRRTSLY